MLVLSPSLLAVDFGHIADNIKLITEAGAEYIHLDVMDGAFVPNISFGQPVIKGLRKYTDKVFDVHLMIEEPIRYLEDYKASGADIVTVHVESCKDVVATIDKAHELGMKAGVAINPKTPISEVTDLLDKVEMVLVMSVQPGFGGQKFMPETLDKAKELRKIITEKGLNVDIQMDGGIGLDNVKEVIDAGVNIIVAGSAVFKNDPVSNVKAFLEIFND